MRPYVSLSASAGSGKTYALSVRFIALVLKGAFIPSIMALTFTKKAAGEMSVRIVDAFLGLHTDRYKSERLSLAFELGFISEGDSDEMIKAANEKIISLRDKYIDEFLSARLKITTFDSFFSSIARSFAGYLGISPSFEISNEVPELAFKAFLKRLSPELTRALAYYIVVANKSESSFFDTLNLLYENGIKLAPKPIHAFSKDLSDKTQSANVALKDICDFVALNGGSATAIKMFKFDFIDEFISARASLLGRDTLDYSTFKGVSDKVGLDDKFNILKDKIKVYLDVLEEFKKAQLAALLSEYRLARASVNKQLDRLSFSDVTLNVYDLLCTQDSPLYESGEFSPAQLYFRLDANISHLLIDEFQDTNVAQYEIMLPLIREITAGVGQNGLGSFFYVGDIKQSIYRFRGGKKELFAKLLEDLGEGRVFEDKLNTNYRSTPEIVQYANKIFARPVIDSYEPQNVHSSQKGYVKISSSSADDMIDDMLTIVKKLLDMGAASRDIAVLCWKNSDVARVWEHLNSAGVAASKEGVLPLWASPVVFGLASYASYCVFGDDIYLLNAKRFLGLKEQALPRLSLDSAKTASQSLIYLANKAGIGLGDAELLQLCELGADKNLIELLFLIQPNSSQAPQSIKSEAGGVQVMTVHKSKGLEFKHVILLDLLSGGSRGGAEFLIEHENGWQVRLAKSGREHVDSEYASLKQKINKRDKEEDFNKLYVAFTRAEISLFVLKNTQSNGRAPSYFAPTKPSKDNPEGIVYYLNLNDEEIGELSFAKTAKAQPKEHKQISLVSVGADSNSLNESSGELDIEAINFGLALHYLLEMAPSFDKQGIDMGALAMRSEYARLLDEGALSDAHKRAYMLINDDKFISLTANANVLKEQDIVALNKQRRVDLLIDNGDEIVVVDYKSSNASKDKNIAQVREYMAMISAAYPQKTVRAEIFYLLAGGIESIEVKS